MPTASAGIYQLDLVVQPGQSYRLLGSIDGVPISADTEVPSDFTIRTPDGDTITALDGTSSGALFKMPYEFESHDASAYGYFVLNAGGTAQAGNVVQGRNGTIVLLYLSGIRDFLFLAYNQDAAEWFVPSDRRSNIQGAFGVFGAALALRRTLSLP